MINWNISAKWLSHLNTVSYSCQQQAYAKQYQNKISSHMVLRVFGSQII